MAISGNAVSISSFVDNIKTPIFISYIWCVASGLCFECGWAEILAHARGWVSNMN